MRATRVARFDAKARQPGDIGGPSVLITLRLTNSSPAAVGLDGVAVTLAYGPDDAPASSVVVGDSRPFEGAVPAGAARTGRYAFNLPRSAALVTVTVTLSARASVIVLRGRVR